MLWQFLLVVSCGGVSSPRGPVFAGYDVVAYQTLPPNASGVFGVVDYIAEFDNRTWWFSSQQNMRAFQAEPLRYVPAYGGFCAWGMATEFMPEYPWNWFKDITFFSVITSVESITSKQEGKSDVGRTLRKRVGGPSAWVPRVTPRLAGR